MEFLYSAYVKGAAQPTDGTIDAESLRDAVSQLKGRGLLVVTIREKQRKARWKFLPTLRFVHVSSTERVLLARHLALILRAGLPIDRALEILQQHGRNKGLKNAITDIVGLVRKGESLSDAFVRYPAVFPPVFIAVVRWGEVGGSLVESLEHLAVQLEKDHDLRVKVRGAFIYPAIVIGATVIVGVIMSVFILPRIVGLLESFKVNLPFTTRLFLALARFLLRYGLYLLPLVVILPVGLFFLFRLRALRPVFHRFLLRIPIIGSLVQQVNLARFDRILGSLLRSGIPTVEALTITRDSMGNVQYRRAVQAVVETASTGTPISREIEKHKLFPPIQVQMVAVGEATGRLADVLLYLADFTERDIDQRTKNLATAIEPLLLLGIGLIVGGVAVSIITPIYQLVGSFSQ